MNPSGMIIHIEWDGPYSLAETKTLLGETNYGVYQIYGGHPVYGSNVLLYIGKAAAQNFGVRIAQEKQWLDNRDAGRVSVYVGRLAGEKTPPDHVWGRQIDLAERLLIYAHYPAFNTQKSIHSIDADLHDVHVFNWGNHRDILPEVSGARWTSKFGPMPGYKEYNTNDPGR